MTTDAEQSVAQKWQGKTQRKNANRINEKKMTENQKQGMERLKDQRLQAFLISLICASSSPPSSSQYAILNNISIPKMHLEEKGLSREALLVMYRCSL